MRKALIVAALLVAISWVARADVTPFTQDPLGPISDVTAHWQDFQPAARFCIKPEGFELTGDQGATFDGTDADCAFSGFTAGDKGLYKVDLGAAPWKRPTPLLCPGCRRIFIDFSKIPAANAPPLYFAHGHIYYRFDTMNPYYIADPYAHSPNTKNFTNDKLFVPNDDSDPRYAFVYGFDTHAMAYTGDTAHFAHATAQGPWYAGPWYVNTAGVRINGVYLDVDVNNCGQSSCSTGNPNLDAIVYRAGFNDGENVCGPDPFTRTSDYSDGNYLYGSCFNHFGFSSTGVDPFHGTR